MGGRSPDELLLRLYIAGQTPNSVLALTTLKTLLEGREHELEVVDVLVTPDRALEDGIFVTPTLVRLNPPPMISIVGSLAAHHELLTGTRQERL